MYPDDADLESVLYPSTDIDTAEEEEEEPYFEEEEITACPACGAENDAGAVLGVLGNREHCRCRYCGADYSHEVE